MTDKTAFEQWWIDQHGPRWEGYISQYEKDNCEASWNEAIDAAIDKIEQVSLSHAVKQKLSGALKSEGALECRYEIQKLRSE